MIPIAQLIELIKIDIEAELPEFLEKHEVELFKEYGIGSPVEKQDLALYVRITGYSGHGEDMSFQIIAHLPGARELEMCRCLDAVNEYLNEHFIPQKYGYMDFDYSILIKDNARTSIDVYWEVTLTDAKDDCDL